MLLQIKSFITSKVIFISLYLLISLSNISILNYFSIFQIANKLLIIWGIFLIPIMLFKRFYKSKIQIAFLEILIFSFLALTLSLTLLYYKDLNNLKIWIINVIILIVLFLPTYTEDRNTLINEFNFICVFFVLITFLLSSLSILMILNSYTIDISSSIFISAYNNPNTLGISAAMSLVISLHLYTNNDISTVSSKYFKYFCTLNIFIQTTSIILSQNRSSFLLIIAYIFTIIYLNFKKKIYRFIIIFIPFISSVYLLIFKFDIISKFLTGRDSIWLTGFEILRYNFYKGIGNTNLVPYLRSMQVSPLVGIEGGEVHNTYLQVAIVNGIIAGVIFLIIILLILLSFFKNYDKIKNTNIIGTHITLVSVILGILLICVTESLIIYSISFITIIFWYFSSILLSIFNLND